MDSKGLFDALDNDLPQDDRMSVLEVPIIEGVYAQSNVSTSMGVHTIETQLAP